MIIKIPTYVAQALSAISRQTEQPKYLAGDGRPCNTDVFLLHIMEHEKDHWDLRERINNWLDGDWEEALEELPPIQETLNKIAK